MNLLEITQLVNDKAIDDVAQKTVSLSLHTAVACAFSVPLSAQSVALCGCEPMPAARYVLV